MRRFGKTTRAVDEAIQALFQKGHVTLHRSMEKHSDFYDPDATPRNMAQSDFVRRVHRRLETEHSGEYTVDGGTITIKPVQP